MIKSCFRPRFTLLVCAMIALLSFSSAEDKAAANSIDSKTETNAPDHKASERTKPFQAPHGQVTPAGSTMTPADSSGNTSSTPSAQTISFTKTEGDMSVKQMPDIVLSPRLTHIIPLEQAASQVFVVDPRVSDIQLPNARTLYIYGRAPGKTELIVTSQDAKTSYRYNVVVKPDFKDLAAIIRSVVPGQSITVTSLPDGLLLQGTVDQASQAEELRLIAKQYAGGEGVIINQLKVRGSSQVNLRVKIAEVQRNVVNSLGINWAGLANHAHMRVGLFTGRSPVINAGTNSFNLPTSAGTPINSMGLRFIDGKNDFSSMIDALVREQLATVLAEPNLVTTSGEEASFLVGGEFPYPIAQGTGGTITITYQFKQYGINLAFRPVVMDGRVVMRVRTEVSDLDTTLGIRDTNGNDIPSIRTRRAESTLEMGDGQTMVLAGLISDKGAAAINALPGLGDIPILGALFRSNEFQSQKTELVILVTPYLVDPLDSAQDVQLPTEGLAFANLSEMAVSRHINRPLDPPAAQVPNSGDTDGFYY